MKSKNGLFVGGCIGSLLAVMTSLIGLLIFALLILNGKVGEGIVSILPTMTAVIGTLLGCAISGEITGDVTLRPRVLVGLIYGLTLCTTGLLMEGNFGNPLKTIFGVGIGVGSSYLVSMNRRRGKRHRKSRSG